MIIDLVVLGLLVLYGLIGYFHGLIGALINLAGCIAGTVVAIVYAPTVAQEVAHRYQIPPIVALPVVAPALLVLVTRAFYLLHLAVRHALKLEEKAGTGSLMGFDRVAGLCYGLVKGGVIAAFLLWALPVALGSGEAARSAGLAESRVLRAARPAMETLARAILTFTTGSKEAATVLAHSAMDPRAAAQGMADVMGSPRLRNLVTSPRLREAAKKGDVGAIVASPEFDAALADEGVQRGLGAMGFAKDAQGRVPREEVTRALTGVGGKLPATMGRLQSTMDDPRVREILEDPAIRQAIQRGELMRVLQDPRVKEALGTLSPALSSAKTSP